jgi:hypothetical protein
LLPLYFGEDRKEFGAKSISLIISLHASGQSLQYWRSVTSTYFANLISGL